MPITGRDTEFVGTISAIYADELGRAPDPGGLASWLAKARGDDGEPPWTGEQLRNAIRSSPEAGAYRNRPKAPPLPSLEISGVDFVQDGQRIVLNGTDQFCAFRQYLDGVDLEPLFAESRELGFTLWRVFLMGSVAQNGILELRPERDGYDNGLRPFADLLNAHGIVLLATVFVDAQDIMRDEEMRQGHWQAIADRLRGTKTLLSAGNEFPKNGFNPGTLANPQMPWSRGSTLGDEPPFQPSGSFLEFHPRRDLPAALMDTVASAVFIRNRDEKPLIIDEPPRMGADGSGAEYADPFTCWKFARHYATECAGAVFHSRSGQRGVLMDPQTRACAEAWSKGIRT